MSANYYSIHILDPRDAQKLVVCGTCGSVVYDTVAHDTDHEGRYAPLLEYPAADEVGKITEPVPPTPITPTPKPRAAKVTET